MQAIIGFSKLTDQLSLEPTQLLYRFGPKVRDLVLGTSDLAKAILKGAVRSRDPAIVRTVIAFVRGTPPAEEVNYALFRYLSFVPKKDIYLLRITCSGFALI